MSPISTTRPTSKALTKENDHSTDLEGAYVEEIAGPD